MDAVDRFETYLGALARPVFPPVPASVEHVRLPPMADIYLSLAADADLPPDQRRFARAVGMDPAVHARACRAWPSFVRQHHLCLWLRERSSFEAVHWIPWLDYRGLDLLGVRDSFAVGVALSVDTERAALWRAIKSGRHAPITGLEIVALDARPRARRVGGVWLHPDEDGYRVELALRRVMADRQSRALLNLAEARLLFDDLKARGVLRAKLGFDGDVRRWATEYNAAVLRRAWGEEWVAQPALPLADEAAGA